MKQLLLLCLALLLFNCKNDLQTERLNSFLNHEPELTQQFFLAPDSIINIQGKKGTKISFKTADLEGILNGPNIKDSLKVDLIELTNKQDLLMANAQTSSNGKWLISGGAFKIDISVNGETLNLKEGRTITVQFPKTSNEESMLLFYGNRDNADNMNWKESEVELKEKKYFSLYYQLASILDIELTRRYEVDMYEDYFLKDSLGFLSYSEYKSLYPKVDSIFVENDTLTNVISWNNYEDFLTKQKKSRLITQNFYEEISTAELGWINIDKFAPVEKKVNIKFQLSEKADATSTYIIDERNNTILNVFEDTIDIPIGRSFLVISFGIKDDTFYGYKKSIRFTDNSEFIHLELKKINKQQIKSFLKLK